MVDRVIVTQDTQRVIERLLAPIAAVPSVWGFCDRATPGSARSARYSATPVIVIPAQIAIDKA
ncbi:MAG: hypothetical protein JOY71_07730 [Acetobacteraceae bacterium]|nr:hypothetical protein [Acetobacteraceae bacterium]MBV8522001.1 hypothetical protein [Acetobacteraceae bacterium]